MSDAIKVLEGSRSVKKAEEKGYTHAVCNKTGETLPLSDFRKHKTGYYLGYSMRYEREQAKARRKKAVSEEFSIDTPSGASYTAPFTFNKISKCHKGALVKFRFNLQHLDDFCPKHALHLLTEVAFECG